jgi:hypothetical protein
MQSYEQSFMQGITVAIIEPSPALGVGLQILLEQYAPEFHTVGIYRDIVSFREQAYRKLDIILLNTAVIGRSEEHTSELQSPK